MGLLPWMDVVDMGMCVPAAWLLLRVMIIV